MSSKKQLSKKQISYSEFTKFIESLGYKERKFDDDLEEDFYENHQPIEFVKDNILIRFGNFNEKECSGIQVYEKELFRDEDDEDSFCETNFNEWLLFSSPSLLKEAIIHIENHKSNKTLMREFLEKFKEIKNIEKEEWYGNSFFIDDDINIALKLNEMINQPWLCFSITSGHKDRYQAVYYSVKKECYLAINLNDSEKINKLLFDVSRYVEERDISVFDTL